MMTRCQFEGCASAHWKGKHTPGCTNAEKLVFKPDESEWALQRVAIYKRYKKAPACPSCDGIYTYPYHLAAHGYGCISCGTDFGRVIKMG